MANLQLHKKLQTLFTCLAITLTIIFRKYVKSKHDKIRNLGLQVINQIKNYQFLSQISILEIIGTQKYYCHVLFK